VDEFPTVQKPPWKIHLIPYSEHSSFTELKEFVAFLRPKRIVPTVGVAGDSGEANAHNMLACFRNLCDMKAAKRDFLMAFGVSSSTGHSKIQKGCSASGQRLPGHIPGEEGDAAGSHDHGLVEQRSPVEDVDEDICSRSPGEAVDAVQSELLGEGMGRLEWGVPCDGEPPQGIAGPSCGVAAACAQASIGVAEGSEKAAAVEASTGKMMAVICDITSSGSPKVLCKDGRESDAVKLLQSITGDAVDSGRAVELLRAAENSVEVALNAFYDGGGSLQSARNFLMPRNASRPSAGAFSGQSPAKRSNAASAPVSTATIRKRATAASKAAAGRQTGSPQAALGPQRSIKSFLSPQCQRAQPSLILHQVHQEHLGSEEHRGSEEHAERASALEMSGGQSSIGQGSSLWAMQGRLSPNCTAIADATAGDQRGGCILREASCVMKDGACSDGAHDKQQQQQQRDECEPCVARGGETLEDATVAQPNWERDLRLSAGSQGKNTPHSTEELMQFALLPLDKCVCLLLVTFDDSSGIPRGSCPLR
jgi:hypothetical protein